MAELELWWGNCLWYLKQKWNPRKDFLQASCQVESPIRRDMQISGGSSGVGWPFHWTFHHLPSHVMYKKIRFPNQGILKWSVSDHIGVLSTAQTTNLCFASHSWRYHSNNTKIKSCSRDFEPVINLPPVFSGGEFPWRCSLFQYAQSLNS